MGRDCSPYQTGGCGEEAFLNKPLAEKIVSLKAVLIFRIAGVYVGGAGLTLAQPEL